MTLRRLRGAEAAQALLTDELAELTAALKANAVGMSAAVAERGRLLDATDTALGESLAATKKNVAVAGEQVKRWVPRVCLGGARGGGQSGVSEMGGENGCFVTKLLVPN